MPPFRHVVVGAGVPETTLSKLPVEVRIVQADWLSTLDSSGPRVDHFIASTVGCFAMMVVYHAPLPRIKDRKQCHRCSFIFCSHGVTHGKQLDQQQMQQNHVFFEGESQDVDV